MSSDTLARTVGLSSAVLISFDRPDENTTAMVEKIAEEGTYVDVAMSVWLHEASSTGKSYFLVVFRHDTPMGIARARLISDLSDRGIHAKIDPL